jgi:hypothetical protein
LLNYVLARISYRGNGRSLRPAKVLGVSCTAKARVPKPVRLAMKKAARLPGRSRAVPASHQS